MIVVTVHLASAIDGSVTELARMHICNAGGTNQLGDYDVSTLRGRSTAALNQHQVQRSGKVLRHPRLREHVWNLVAKALAAMSYGPAVQMEISGTEVPPVVDLLERIS